MIEMKKEDILAKSKSQGLDEREQMIEGDSFSYGLIAVLSLVLIFGVWKLIHGVKSYELISIFTGYIAASSFYKYKKLVSKKFLAAGILGMLATIASAVAFFIAG